MAGARGGRAQDAELRVVATAPNEPEAAVICGVLTGAGTRNMSQPDAATPARSYRPEVARSIYVREDDLERAREVLAQARGESGEAPGGGHELEHESTARSGELGGLLRRVGDALRRHDADHDNERTP